MLQQPPPAGEPNSDRSLVVHLIVGYLAHSGQWHPQRQDERPHDPRTAEILKALLALTDEYERRYKSQLAKLVASWDLNGAILRQSFTQVLDTVFLDGCNWGRVVTVFIFVGMFLRKSGHHATPDEVAEWSADYLIDRLSTWIRAHGGWMGLVHFYHEGDSAGQLAHEGHLFKRFLTVAGAGLVLLTLGSLLKNRA